MIVFLSKAYSVLEEKLEIYFDFYVVFEMFRGGRIRQKFVHSEMLSLLQRVSVKMLNISTVSRDGFSLGKTPLKNLILI